MTDTDQLLQQGIAEFKANNRQQAARLFYQVTQADPHNQVAWLWLGGCLDDDQDKRQCLERARSINPDTEAGKRAAQGLMSIPRKPSEVQDIPLPDFPDVSRQPMSAGNNTTVSTQPDSRTAGLPSKQNNAPAKSPSGAGKEKIVVRGTYHWSMLIPPIFTAVLIGLIGVFFLMSDIPPICSGGIFFVGIPLVVSGIINYVTSEFIVTNRRITGKTGFFRRTSLELLLTKAEAIHVNQGLIERMFGVGTVTVVGSGGTKNAFPHLANAEKIRRAIQDQISFVQDRSP